MYGFLKMHVCKCAVRIFPCIFIETLVLYEASEKHTSWKENQLNIGKHICSHLFCYRPQMRYLWAYIVIF